MKTHYAEQKGGGREMNEERLKMFENFNHVTQFPEQEILELTQEIRRLQKLVSNNEERSDKAWKEIEAILQSRVAQLQKENEEQHGIIQQFNEQTEILKDQLSQSQQENEELQRIVSASSAGLSHEVILVEEMQTIIGKQKSEIERLGNILRRINVMAAEEVRLGHDKGLLYQIEADSRAALTSTERGK